MAHRDTYNEYVTRQDIANEPYHIRYNPGSDFVTKRRDALIARSGVFNTMAGKLHTIQDVRDDTLRMRVSFDSRAWTG